MKKTLFALALLASLGVNAEEFDITVNCHLGDESYSIDAVDVTTHPDDAELMVLLLPDGNKVVVPRYKCIMFFRGES